MSNRHALLIGVPRYDHDEFNAPRLDDAVRCDIDAMRAALKQSDYIITECGTGPNADVASLNRINQKIEEACASASAGSVLLVYFSGHGLSEAGIDYLVPSDAYVQGGNRSGGRPSLRSLVKIVPPDDVLRDCRASLVVLFVDACRNESDTPASAKPIVEPGGQLPFLADGALSTRDRLRRGPGLPVRRDRQRLHPRPGGRDRLRQLRADPGRGHCPGRQGDGTPLPAAGPGRRADASRPLPGAAAPRRAGPSL